MVTSLHDSMNLSPEFISVRDDEEGAHPEPVHRRVVRAAGRHPGEPLRRGRMADAIAPRSRSERERRAWAASLGVREHNIYRWAGLLLASERIPDPVATRAAAGEEIRGRTCVPPPLVNLQEFC
jgi:hypothetical protein